jgi:TRAP-type C4-dicarboxylate transport system permease small subunit
MESPIAWVRRLSSEMTSPPPPGWTPSYPLIRRIDHAWYIVERVVTALMFLLMGLMVFVSVIAEVFSTRREWSDVAVLFAITLLAVRTRAVKEGERKLSWPLSFAAAAALTAALAGLVHLYVERYPGGFIWAGKLALVLMVWVALIGTSIAAYERSHLALEMGEKLWPERALRFVKAFAHAVTAAFCVIALVISIDLVFHQRKEADLIPTIDWLYTWEAFLVMPYAFAAMAIRFLGQAFTTVAQSAEPPGEQLPT